MILVSCLGLLQKHLGRWLERYAFVQLGCCRNKGCTVKLRTGGVVVR